MCSEGVSNEDFSSSTGVGLSNRCQWMFNESSLMPWCHGVVHFETKMSRFSSCFEGRSFSPSGPHGSGQRLRMPRAKVHDILRVGMRQPRVATGKGAEPPPQCPEGGGGGADVSVSGGRGGRNARRKIRPARDGPQDGLNMQHHLQRRPFFFHSIEQQVFTVRAVLLP